MASRIFIRGVNWLGDSVLTLPAVRALRSAYPSAFVTLQCPRWLSPLWRAIPHVDRVIGFEGTVDSLRCSHGLRHEGYDTAIVLPNSFHSALCAFLTGAAVRLGYGRYGRSLLLSKAVAVRDDDLADHEVFYYLNLLKGLGLDPESFDPTPSLKAPEHSARKLEEALAGRPAIGLNPGSGQGTARLWPAERYAKLAARLKEAYSDHELLIFGGPGDGNVADQVVSGLDVPATNLAGKTTLEQFLGALSCLSLYITNDNGSMHAACALGIPVVAVFGGSNPATTGPFSTKATVVRKEVACAPCIKKDCPTDHCCMRAVEVEDVFLAAREAMNAAGGD